MLIEPTDVTVSPVQPYAARKRYVCPGCDGPVGAGEFHLVVVPNREPELRRHWHRGCWFREVSRHTSGIQRT